MTWNKEMEGRRRWKSGCKETRYSTERRHLLILSHEYDTLLSRTLTLEVKRKQPKWIKWQYEECYGFVTYNVSVKNQFSFADHTMVDTLPWRYILIHQYFCGELAGGYDAITRLYRSFNFLKIYRSPCLFHEWLTPD